MTQKLQLEASTAQVWRLALPISLALLIPQINFITNNIFLGQLGVEALGVAGITGVYYLIFAAIGAGLNNGLQSLISRRAGENRREQIGILFSQGIRISMVIAALGILITYFVAPIIYRQVIADPERQEMIIRFLRIRIWGLPFLYIYQMRNALLVGTNQSRFLIAGTLAETLANVFFDYSLIYGKFGLPALGFNGAAYASIIAEFSGMIIVFAVIHYKGISRQFALYKSFAFDKLNTRLILTQSSPLVLQHAISIISWQFFYVLIEHHGATDLAISNTMRNIFGFFGVFTWAFAATSNTMVSNVIGQGREDLVPVVISKIVKISSSIGFLVCLLLNIFPETFLSIYGQDEAFIHHGIPILRIVSTALVLMSFSVVWLNAVTGTGSTRVNLLIETITITAYCIYVYLVLEFFHLPILYGWMSEWLYWISLFTMSYLFMKSGRWKGRKL